MNKNFTSRRSHQKFEKRAIKNVLKILFINVEELCKSEGEKNMIFCKLLLEKNLTFFLFTCQLFDMKGTL